ncbi:hypothetical protein C8J57DRAFT_1587151 [Mycena rebaudengoi]|nr:hypothetical protein C8J57DRAFT_1587151 [Mycena rebaudengoi]
MDRNQALRSTPLYFLRLFEGEEWDCARGDPSISIWRSPTVWGPPLVFCIKACQGGQILRRLLPHPIRSRTYMEPDIRVFGLIIGIDQYKAGAVWNLESCVDDAQKVQRWLRKDLRVPKEQICMLLDEHATKDNIEQSFLRHLVNNDDIKRGDAIIIYFSGHGSTIAAPPDWFHKGSVSGTAEVLCSYDFGQRGVAGISDRSLHSMLTELSAAKGDNIVVILDSCFAPLRSPANIRDRRNTRWTPADKLLPHDLLDWSLARCARL